MEGLAPWDWGHGPLVVSPVPPWGLTEIWDMGVWIFFTFWCPGTPTGRAGGVNPWVCGNLGPGNFSVHPVSKGVAWVKRGTVFCVCAPSGEKPEFSGVWPWVNAPGGSLERGPGALVWVPWANGGV